MSRLGHHLYTSLGGQRTIHLSPWLAAWKDVMESRAAEAYGQQGIDLLGTDGLWILTCAGPNGTDHVGRQRTLVHQLVVEQAHMPAGFSPLILRQAALSRLDADDPGLPARLTAVSDGLAPVSAPDLAKALRGGLRPLLAGLLGRTARGEDGGVFEVPIVRLAEQLVDLPAALAVGLVRQRQVHVSGLARPLRPLRPCLQLFLVDAAQRPRAEGDAARLPALPEGDIVLQALASHRDPSRLLAFLAGIPPQAWARTLTDPALIRILVRLSLAQDGTPLCDPVEPDTRVLVNLLLQAGAEDLVRRMLTGWSPFIDPDEHDHLDDCLDQPETGRITRLLNVLADKDSEFPSLPDTNATGTIHPRIP